MTYTTLLDALRAWLRKPELEQQLPTFVLLAEAKLNRQLAEHGLVGAVKRTDATVDAEYMAPPDDLAIPTSLTFSTGEIVENVSPRSLELLREGEDAEDAQPTKYAVVGSELRFYPVPDASYSAELVYEAKLLALGDSNPSNWLLAGHPDAYLYGALVQAGPFLDDEPRLNGWAALYSASVDEVLKAERAKRGQPNGKLRTEFPLRRQGFNINTGV